MCFLNLENLTINCPQRCEDFKINIENKIGLKIIFKKAPDTWNVAARNNYIWGNDCFFIALSNSWKEVDLLHELIHAYLMFDVQIPIAEGISNLWKHPVNIIRNYMEDFIVHRKIVGKTEMVPFNSKYVPKIERYVYDLKQKDGKMANITERNACPFCENLFIAFEALQVLDFSRCDENIIRKETKKTLKNFIKYFEKAPLMRNLVFTIYKELKSIYTQTDFSNLGSYTESIKRICSSSYFEIEGNTMADNYKLFHFKKNGNGFVPSYN